jgi:oligopeptide transport system ATP-binding protein
VPVTKSPVATPAVGSGSASDAEIVLSARGLVRHFPTQGSLFTKSKRVVRAVDGVDLDLHRGQTVGVVGESGSGKSTLARLLLALDKPTAGTVTLEGRDLFALSRRELRQARRDIQIVMQDPYTSLDPRMTAGQIIAEPFRIHRNASRDNPDRAVRDLLETVGLNPDHINRYPHQFSGGQRQRIGIARAIALRPKVVICDEPVSALDVSVQAQVINLLADLQKEYHLSYIFIAHDLSVVEHVSDQVAVMYLGKIVERGNTDQIFDRPTHPYTQALLSAAPSTPGEAQSGERIILEGEIPSPLDVPSGCAFRTRCWKAQQRCVSDVPQLALHGESDHHSACHFAAPR